MKNSSFITKYLVARNNPPKQRLEFPVVREHRKHYGEGVRDQVVLAHDERNYSLKSAKHSNLDVSDIDGARPRIGPKARSEKHLNWPSSVDNAEIRDELDHLVRGKLHKRDLSLKQLGRLN